MVKYSIQFRAVDSAEVMPTSAADHLVRIFKPQGILKEIGENSPVPASRKQIPAKHSRKMQPDIWISKNRKLVNSKVPITTNAATHTSALPAATPNAKPQAAN